MPDLKRSIAYRFLQESKFDRKTIFKKKKNQIFPTSLYKEYQGVSTVSLPRLSPKFKKGLLTALQNRRSRRKFIRKEITFNELSALLWSSQGISGRMLGIDLRTAPSAGALYPIETYILINRVEDISPGIYHFNLKKYVLEQLQLGDFASKLAQSCLGQMFVADASVNFCWSAVLRRNMSKYGSRGMRYIFMDVGHICQNLLLSAEALDIAACPVGAFLDEEINALLNLDGEEESIIYCASVGKDNF